MYFVCKTFHSTNCSTTVLNNHDTKSIENCHVLIIWYLFTSQYTVFTLGSETWGKLRELQTQEGKDTKSQKELVSPSVGI